MAKVRMIRWAVAGAIVAAALVREVRRSRQAVA
jgi:hypothetical protein